MRTVLLGPPGSGKGTQGIILSKKYHIPQISTGELLRTAVNSGHESGERAKMAINEGDLVSDSIVIDLIRERLSEQDAKDGYILDGFPRNIIQAESLDIMLGKLDKALERVIFFDIDHERLMRRLSGRRICNNCGAIYNIYSSIPLMEDNCDNCDGTLFRRVDDHEEIINNRIRVYQKQTVPLINYYNGQDKLYSIPGAGDLDNITNAFSSLFGKI